MLFSLVIAIMVILVTAFWVYQGMFSAMIMFFLSVVSCLIAFGFYEQVHALWAGSLDGGIGLPLALMLLFLASLLGLRFLADKLIPDNIRLPVILDRAGGGVCGLFIGLILVGTSLTAIQMLPIGASVFGFERLEAQPDGTVKAKSFSFFNPDGFTVGLATMLSNNRFGGTNRLAESKPDLLLDLYSARANPQPEERVFLSADAMTVKGWWKAQQIDVVDQRVDGESLAREFRTEDVVPGKTLIVCRVRVDAGAAKSGAEIRFRTSQFRLVGPPPSNDPALSTTPEVILACGLSDIYTHKAHGMGEMTRGQETRLVRFGPQTDFILGPNSSRPIALARGSGDQKMITAYQFDVAFEVPEGFDPWYIEFKRGARAELTKALFQEEVPTYASVAGGKAKAPAGKRDARDGDKAGRDGDSDSDGDTEKKDSTVKVGKGTGGATHVADAIAARTGVFTELPFPLSGGDSVVRNSLREGKLDDCHFFVEIPDPPPEDWDVREFKVPDGKKLVQVGAEKKDALSLFGRALNYATNVAAQIKVTDENGNDYFAIGVYSAAPVNGKMVLEIQYHPEAEMPERCLVKAKRVTSAILSATSPDERKFGYLFLVDPGVKIVSFSAGARQNARQELIIEVPQ